MGAFEDAIQLKKQGATDQQITQILNQQGVPPREILEAIEKVNLKNSITEIPIQMEAQYPQQGYGQGYQQSGAYDQQYANQGYAPEYGAVPGNFQQEAYPQEAYYPPEQVGDSNLIIELAEQVFSEKMQKIQKQMDELNELKSVMQVKLDSVSKSVERIENIINSLQTSVLEKVGSYGQGINSIKKEMEMMQETFSRTMPELVRKKN